MCALSTPPGQVCRKTPSHAHYYTLNTTPRLISQRTAALPANADSQLDEADDSAICEFEEMPDDSALWPWSENDKQFGVWR